MSEQLPRVLLVDDERLARQIYSDYLVAAGCEVDTAESAQMARALFRSGRYQLVVTDLLLPDSDGLEVLAEVKRHDPEVDVIVITAHEKVEPAVRALRMGASDYLVKPVTPDTLQLAVSRTFGMRRILRENQALKSSLVMFETSHRLSACTDRSQAAEALMPVLMTDLRASAGALFCTAAGVMELTRSEGLAMDEETVLVDALLAGPLHAIEGTTAQLMGSLPGQEDLPSIAGMHATLVPFRTDAGLFGAAVMFSPHMPVPSSLRGVDFLARSAAVALQTIDRHAHAEKLAYIDDLTHLHNGRFLKQALEREVVESADGAFSVLFLDLDHFKQVNDTFGHLIGSRLLQEVGRVLRGCVRERDVGTRYGGDEFCVLLRRADKATAVHIAERIRASIANHTFLAREGKNIRITASIGIACFPEHARDAVQLLDLADQAMYRGKRATRNTVYLAAATTQAA